MQAQADAFLHLAQSLALATTTTKQRLVIPALKKERRRERKGMKKGMRRRKNRKAREGGEGGGDGWGGGHGGGQKKSLNSCLYVMSTGSSRPVIRLNTTTRKRKNKKIIVVVVVVVIMVTAAGAAAAIVVAVVVDTEVDVFLVLLDLVHSQRALRKPRAPPTPRNLPVWSQNASWGVPNTNLTSSPDRHWEALEL